MKYAVIAISGTQYQVEEGQTITVDKLDTKNTSTDQVLLYVNDKEVTVGTPTIKDLTVEYKIIKNHPGKKVKVFKYRSKSRYSRQYGFRPKLTDIQITKIGAVAPSVKPKTVKKTIKKSTIND